MNLRFRVAGHTITFKRAKLPICMTTHTLNFCMLSSQWEAGSAMIEIGNIARTIMASQAVIPHRQQVLSHEPRIIIGMTILTCVGLEGQAVLLAMAVFACHGREIIINLMPSQDKVGLIVIEKSKSRGSGIKIPA